MSGVKVSALAYGRLTAPDLNQAEKFLIDFGLTRAFRTESALYMRGTDAGPYNHIVELGEPAFKGMGFEVAEKDDLERAAAIPGASPMQAVPTPGKGMQVQLVDPNGFRVELNYGLEHLPEITVTHHVVNRGNNRLQRAGTFYRRPNGPALVKRLGHFVIGSPHVKATRDWYRRFLGLLGTDDVFAGSEDNVIASFNRINLGDEYVDHHVFMTHHAEKPMFNHFGFEVQDIDDVLFGHHHLKGGAATHRTGLGRHVLGSQVYNQYADPWGRGYEHWTDTDVLTASHPVSLMPAAQALVSQWGDPPSANLQK